MSKPAAAIASPEYRQFVEDLKTRVISARIAAARHVNRDLILLYWDIGRAIVEKQKQHDWGDAVVESVAADLRMAFPSQRGFSSYNLWGMRLFYIEYSSPEFLEQLVPELKGSQRTILEQPVQELAGCHEAGQSPGTLQRAAAELTATIPWGHHLELLKKVKAPAARLWYIQATARFGWSRNVLLNQIKAEAYERAVLERKTHNFPTALPEHLAEQAEEMLKISYNLEFLGIRRAIRERELEARLIERLKDFLLELGYGFCFIGRQHRLTLGQKEYFIDLLFYHRFLKTLVAFELKTGPFEPEYAGKMDFYLNLLNDKERGEGDGPSIGIILCAEKDDVEVEYSLRTKQNPIGMAMYQLQSKLPGELRGKLPTAKQLVAMVRAELVDQS
jgi:predicted nuclease of restriction endonuclease-like (RecB) superfamily